MKHLRDWRQAGAGAALLLLGILLAGCTTDQRIDPAVCQPLGNAEPICGLQNPEDLALLPDGKTLVVSGYGVYFLANPGVLSLLDTDSGVITRLPSFDTATRPLWADLDCPGPPGAALSPHGLHLSRRNSGELQLLVVNHGGGERIEFIELEAAGDTYQAHWRGCLSAPENSYINSVAATPEGGLIMSHMYPMDSPVIGVLAWDVAKSLFGLPSGYLLEWPGQGREFRILPGSQDGFPNGVLVSADGRHVFMAASTGGRVIKLDRHSGERLASVEIAHPDNLRWTADGDILVTAAPVSGLRMIACQQDSARDINCGAAFEVLRLNSADLSVQTLYRHPGGPPMGAATVAQQVGDALYLGSYAGNRLLRVPIGD